MILLHGLAATADLNWFRCYRSLGQHYRVVALDHRGHGRGIRSRRPFRLSDCADDVAALIDALRLERPIAVGYSMGGPIAQLLWRRHPDRVGGLVLCATSRSFTRNRAPERFMVDGLLGVAVAARLTPRPLRKQAASFVFQRSLSGTPLGEWAARELGRSDAPAVIQAVRAVARFDSRPWIGEVDVPTAVVVTRHDRLVPPTIQHKLARDLPTATVHEIAADHAACVAQPHRFVPALLDGCRSVSRRLPSTPAPRSAPS